MFYLTAKTGFLEVSFYCCVNHPQNRGEKHVLQTIVNIRKIVFQTAECGIIRNYSPYFTIYYMIDHANCFDDLGFEEICDKCFAAIIPLVAADTIPCDTPAPSPTA